MEYLTFMIPVILWAITFLVIIHCEKERVSDFEFTNKKIDGLYNLIHKMRIDKNNK